MESILNPAYPHIFEKIFMCLNRDFISNFRLLNHHWKNTLEIVFTKDLARLMLLRIFKELADIIRELAGRKEEYFLWGGRTKKKRKFSRPPQFRPPWELEDTHRDILQKLGKIWLNLIEFLNQENLWSHDVTENMFLCINRICCLIQHQKWKPDYYLQGRPSGQKSASATSGI